MPIKVTGALFLSFGHNASFRLAKDSCCGSGNRQPSPLNHTFCCIGSPSSIHPIQLGPSFELILLITFFKYKKDFLKNIMIIKAVLQQLVSQTINLRLTALLSTSLS